MMKMKIVLHNKEDYMKTTALIMAGGKGERFWPKSRVNMPKQFLSSIISNIIDVLYNE